MDTALSSHTAQGEEEESIADQNTGPGPAPLMEQRPDPGTVSNILLFPITQSPTEALTERALSDLHSTPMRDFLLSSPDTGSIMPQFSPHTAIDLPALMTAFSAMLSTGLAQTATQITSTIQADLQQLGARIDVIEKKSDQANGRINQNTARIQDLQDQLDSALYKIDDLENRSRRSNFRIRGLPETVTDVPAAVRSLLKDLLPDISEHRMELDRAHRALQPLRKDGLPRDIIVKPHFYEVKEGVMKASRAAEQILLQGQPIQIFADLSPYTIQKRRALKPLLQTLIQRNIKYRWAFPLRLNFSFQNKSYGFSTFEEGEHLLTRLGIITQDLTQPADARSTPPTKRPSPSSPTLPTWQKQQSKRSKDSRPPR